MKRLFFDSTTGEKSHDVGLLILRVGVGLILFYYGAQKALGVWGGFGFEATMNNFTSKMGIPAPLAFLAIAAELLGGLGLAVGLLTRIAAFGVFTTMMVAFSVHMNQSGLGVLATGDGAAVKDMAYPLILGLGALVFVLGGAGRFSIDALINRK